MQANPTESMVMIRYRVRPEEVDRHLELLRAVFQELASADPDGLGWAAFQLEDKVSFVDLVVGGGEGRLSRLEAFGAFRAGLDNRCDEPPILTGVRRVGSFRFP